MTNAAQQALSSPKIRLQSSWKTALAVRARHLFWLKTAGVTAVTFAFLAGYFYLLQYPISTPTMMPLTVIDAAIPLQPPMMLAYLSLWLYVGVGPGLELRLRDLLAYAAWMSAMCASALLIFLLYPTQVPVAAPASMDFFGFELIRGIDTAANAFPSMHVAAAVFTVVRIDETLQRIVAPAGLRVVNALWCACILYSTLAVKQHVVVDILGGILLALIFVWPSQIYRPRPVA